MHFGAHMTTTYSNHKPIGVFDSGMGGLTVLRALKKHLPNESFIYLGDTARLPYGTKSTETITAYAHQMVHFLVKQNIKLIVIACNTASMAALEPLMNTYPDIPMVGVIKPGTQAIIQSNKNNHAAVLATDATIQSGIYERSIAALNPNIKVTTIACGLFVALAEEGCVDDAIAEAAMNKYLAPIILTKNQPDSVLLGCTHFPVLKNSIQRALGTSVKLIDSAETTTTAVKALLKKHHFENKTGKSTTVFYVTDSPKRFIQKGELFFGEKITANDIELVHTGTAAN